MRFSSLPRSAVPLGPDNQRRPVLKGTWAFKLKRFPDGTPHKFKARYCVRGDLQREGIDFFETYAPVVQWSTVRMLLTLVLANKWITKQVDYTNAFAQATLHEEVYIEPPRGFGRRDGGDLVQRHHRAINLDHHRIEQSGVGTPGAQALKIALQRFNFLLEFQILNYKKANLLHIYVFCFCFFLGFYLYFFFKYKFDFLKRRTNEKIAKIFMIVFV